MLLKVIFVFVIAKVMGQNVIFGNTRESNKKCSEKPMPYFPGRISERKCEQYLWEKKERIRKEKCINSNVGITNGVSSNITEYPHMAAIGWPFKKGDTLWDFQCGGSLISHNFVLTAAHCTKTRQGEPKIVRLGATIIREGKPDFADKPIDIEIKRVLRHPKYNSPLKYFDIALLELSQEVNFTKFIQPACLWTEAETDASMKYFVTGWGQLGYRGARSNDLQSAKVKIVENCKKYTNSLINRLWNGLQDHQICAGDSNRDTCQGDSGGPLQFKTSKTGHELDVLYKIVAITTFGEKCATRNVPGIYTKVFNFIDWIEEQVWPETNNPNEDQAVNDNTNGEKIQLRRTFNDSSSQAKTSRSPAHRRYGLVLSFIVICHVVTHLLFTH